MEPCPGCSVVHEVWVEWNGLHAMATNSWKSHWEWTLGPLPSFSSTRLNCLGIRLCRPTKIHWSHALVFPWTTDQKGLRDPFHILNDSRQEAVTTWASPKEESTSSWVFHLHSKKWDSLHCQNSSWQILSPILEPDFPKSPLEDVILKQGFLTVIHTPTLRYIQQQWGHLGWELLHYKLRVHIRLTWVPWPKIEAGLCILEFFGKVKTWISTPDFLSSGNTVG